MDARGRVLAIDAGERRVGLAMSDELGMLATPLAVLRRGDATRPVVDEIAALARRERVGHVVVGLPLHADGGEGRQAERARAFARAVEAATGLSVEMWDERLSTLEAEAVIRGQGRSTRRARQRGDVDAVAAAVILQSYLDARDRERRRPRGDA